MLAFEEALDDVRGTLRDDSECAVVPVDEVLRRMQAAAEKVEAASTTSGRFNWRSVAAVQDGATNDDMSRHGCSS